MLQMKGFWRNHFTRVFILATLLTMTLGFVGLPFTQTIASARVATTNGCQLNSPKGNIQHVIYIQFDNVHFTRDNPNVPSDLEQMPNLLNFIENNGVLLTNHHTPLISHTANDILTSLTGVYGDRHGVPVANSFRYFNPDGTSNPGVSFAYWNGAIFDPSTTTPTDTTFNMLTAQNKNAPAPWVPYTRKGCNFGSVATANTILENINVDVSRIYGPNSPQQAEVVSNPNQASADFVGIGVHCALNNSLCSTANTGQPDLLPDEPGGYTGYMGLFGNKYVAPQISPNGPVTDLNGNVIQSPTGNVGFPGFDGMEAPVSLAYVADMQEHDVPITYAYISDAHDMHPSGPAFGPGQAGYVAALKSYNDAFGKFFTRLANDGINQSNTLFVFTADEGDHFVGGPPSPAGCDGVTTPCTYSQIGELNANLAGLLATQQGNTTPFKVHSDSAPTIYITADPARDPTLTMFADPNYFLFAGAPNCTLQCVTQLPGFAWNHGDVQPEITTTWLGMVGPGVAQGGIDSTTWSDHTDIRPTMMTLLGLKDDYSHDGRALVEDLNGYAKPAAVKQSGKFVALSQIYKQLDACVGQFGLKTLSISTRALESNDSGDSTYTNLENQLLSFDNQRDALAAQMIALLEGAEFNGQPFSNDQAKSLIAQGQALLDQVNNV
jgi:hypothetical protein